MTTFGWKRKVGQNILKDPSINLSEEFEEDHCTADKLWVQSFKRKKKYLQESCNLKYEEFKTAGIKLAEKQKFEEAVAEWDRALNLVPNDYKILEMKAQALLQLNLPFAAVQAAERAIKYNSCWWIGYQTLGRSQLGMGEIEMAKRSFCKAIHLNPSVEELWEEDLKWTVELIKKKSERKEIENSK